MKMENVVAIALALFLSPIVGGVVAGIDRKITARLQGRYGPPILQPFYDVMKLIGKESMIVNLWQILCAYVYLVAAILTVVLLALQSDLLLIFFVLAVGGVFLVIGALAAQSPYSQIGAQRELIQMLTYEPLLILVFVSIYLVTGSYKISEILKFQEPLLIPLALMYIVLGYALTIKLRKSPFDISTSHHAHQEIVKGVLTEYSGPYLAIIEIAHWYETVFVLGICALFWHTNVYIMVLLVVLTYLAEIIIDNVCARLTWRWMLGYVWSAGLLLSFANYTWIYVR
ncbi:NADH-quinone oxidoreductase subunit H [Geomonas sp. RF6]|uniref:respiratory chain complex I subunit 1 family protein n=1 Tax=Geomonas sp. RF6 TaxID=2897342 RepID=UPI001E491EAD|nr:NADH-quinone oxidoreductase subunit H [Geomonas sp. RF6]UFS70416.1 NADH-quinone oxidoreductase subunit H [Geomonas sp. RF6]